MKALDLLNALAEGVSFEDFGSSTIVFHSPHAGQRPIHLGLSFPQDVQYQTVFAFVIIHKDMKKCYLCVDSHFDCN